MRELLRFWAHRGLNSGKRINRGNTVHFMCQLIRILPGESMPESAHNGQLDIIIAPGGALS